MMKNSWLVIGLSLAAGCGVVNGPSHNGGGGDDDDTGSDGGSAVEPPPSTPLTFYGGVADERADQIAFTGGQPVHTHAGAIAKFDGIECPAIYKYAYLMDRAPKFGREVSPNPLAIKITADDSLDASASTYQVRTEDNRVVIPWTAMAAADGSYTMTLQRDDIAELGTKVGKYYVDARFHDAQGVETVKTQCFENHPLAAPLQVGTLTKSTLFGYSLASQSPISYVLDAGAGVAVASLPITQTTAEAIDISFTGTVSGTGTQAHTDQWVTVNTTDMNAVLCESDTASGMDCDKTDNPAPIVTAATRTALGGTWNLVVVDDATGSTMCSQDAAFHTRCTIPARGLAEAPHAYHVIVSDARETSAWPSQDGTFAEYIYGDVTLTGHQISTRTQCNKTRAVNGRAACTQTITFAHIITLDSVKLELSSLKLAATSNIGDAAMPSLPADALTMSATWDGGSR